MRVQFPLPRLRAIQFDSADLPRDALSEAFQAKLDLFSYGSLTPLELHLDLWYFRTVAELALGLDLRDFLPHIV